MAELRNISKAKVEAYKSCSCKSVQQRLLLYKKPQANFTTLRNEGMLGASKNEKSLISFCQDLYRELLNSSKLKWTTYITRIYIFRWRNVGPVLLSTECLLSAVTRICWQCRQISRWASNRIPSGGGRRCSCRSRQGHQEHIRAGCEEDYGAGQRGLHWWSVRRVGGIQGSTRDALWQWHSRGK